MAHVPVFIRDIIMASQSSGRVWIWLVSAAAIVALVCLAVAKFREMTFFPG